MSLNKTNETLNEIIKIETLLKTNPPVTHPYLITIEIVQGCNGTSGLQTFYTYKKPTLETVEDAWNKTQKHLEDKENQLKQQNPEPKWNAAFEGTYRQYLEEAGNWRKAVAFNKDEETVKNLEKLLEATAIKTQNWTTDGREPYIVHEHPSLTYMVYKPCCCPNSSNQAQNVNQTPQKITLIEHGNKNYYIVNSKQKLKQLQKKTVKIHAEIEKTMEKYQQEQVVKDNIIKTLKDHQQLLDLPYREYRKHQGEPGLIIKIKYSGTYPKNSLETTLQNLNVYAKAREASTLDESPYDRGENDTW